MNAYINRTSQTRPLIARPRKPSCARSSEPRTKKDHLRWLNAQGFKEYSAIKPIIDALTTLYPNVDRGVDRHDYAELTEKLADETKHARLVMDLLEEMTGKKVTPRDLPGCRKIASSPRFAADIRKASRGCCTVPEKSHPKRSSRKDEAVERAAITLTEGGGGALYHVCSKLKKHGIEGKIARVFHEILLDEVGHKEAGTRALGELIKEEKSFRRAAKIICEVSGQRLRMRNEQFGFPVESR